MFTRFINTHKALLGATLMSLLLFVVPVIASAQTSFIQEQIWNLVAIVFGRMVWFGGLLLDVAITDFVVGFGDIYANYGLGYSVDNLWSTVRDIFNLTFVFGLVYIGFKLIFNSSDSSARKMLGSLVLAALLVNFSLFITKFVIDFSNIAATQFAAGFKVGSEYEVSTSFMNLLGISGIWNPGDLPVTSSGWAYIFGTMILFIVAAFVFFAGGLLLMIRFAVLNIYMVLSPIMFLGMVFPGFSSASRDYWNGFLQRAFFAPAYILMIYLSHQILVNFKSVSGSGAKIGDTFSSSAAPAQASFAQTIPFFILSTVFLVASIVVAQKMGAQGATTAVAMGKRYSNRMKKIAAGTAGQLPRRAINPLGEKFEKSFNRLQTKDFKNSGVVAGSLGALARTNIIDRRARATTTAMQNAQLGTGTTNKIEADYKAKTISRVNQNIAENKRSETFESSYKAITENTASAKDLENAINSLGASIKGMTKDEKNGLGLNKLSNQSIAIHLSDDDIKNIEASGKYAAAEVQQIKDAKKAGFVSIASHGTTLTKKNASGGFELSHESSTILDKNNQKTIRAEFDQRKSIIATMAAKDAGKLPTDIFKNENTIQYITPEMLSEKIKNGGISNEDMTKIKSTLQEFLNQPVTPENKAKKAAWKKWIENTSMGTGLGLEINERTPEPEALVFPPIIDNQN